MSSPRLETLLLRTLVALAWADGSVDAEEVSFLRGLIAEYGLDEAEAREVLALLDQPLGLAEFEEHARAFLRAGRQEDRVGLLARAEKLVEANGTTDGSERRYLHLLTAWAGEARAGRGADGVGGPGRGRGIGAGAGDGASGPTERDGDGGGVLLGRFGRLLGRATPSTLGAAVRGLFLGTAVNAERSPREAYVVLFGALLYRVIYADRVVEAAEALHLRDLLGARFGFAPGEADTVLRLIQQRVAEDHDRQRLCAEFNRVSGPEERQQLLAALLALAAVDGEVSAEEEREIRLIANYLWIEVQDFVSIRREVLGR